MTFESKEELRGAKMIEEAFPKIARDAGLRIDKLTWKESSDFGHVLWVSVGSSQPRTVIIPFAMDQLADFADDPETRPMTLEDVRRHLARDD